jgi:DNA-binding Xre family transcriptional regulator
MRNAKEREEIMKILRDAIWDHGDPQLLANRVGLSLSCVNNLRSGKTKWPRPDTMFSLCSALNLRLTLTCTNT